MQSPQSSADQLTKRLWKHSPVQPASASNGISFDRHAATTISATCQQNTLQMRPPIKLCEEDDDKNNKEDEEDEEDEEGVPNITHK